MSARDLRGRNVCPVCGEPASLGDPGDICMACGDDQHGTLVTPREVLRGDWDGLTWSHVELASWTRIIAECVERDIADGVDWRTGARGDGP